MSGKFIIHPEAWERRDGTKRC